MNVDLPNPWRIALLLGWIAFGGIPAAAQSQSPSELRFNRDIRPILANACFRCHGIDGGHREADLRLDLEEFATAARDSGRPVVPGDRDQSLIWQRIQSTDPDLVMPPPTARHQLTEGDKNTIGRWISQGAKYERHWAFEPIVAPKLAEDTATQKEALPAIDRFMALEHQRRGLAVNGRADPRTLVRRLAFALTGLPPEPDDAERFAANPSEEEYIRLVEQYLESPHYGEEMAKHWLDVARYGDTHGLHLDNDRLIWPYRDWVVHAFQSNMPFSQFTIEQLAGDLLPNPTQSQLVATGFNRCNVTTSEGGAIDEEFLYRYAVDRTSTTIQTWLGLTGGCAVCHDHKYDPLSMRDFYSMYSFFYSAADPAMDGNVNTTAPFLKLTGSTDQQTVDTYRQQESNALKSLLAKSRDWSRVVDKRIVPEKRPATYVWLDDELPLGANQRNTSRNGMSWTDSSQPTRIGQRSLVTEFGDRFEQVLSGFLVPLWIPEQGKLHAWIRMDPQEPPSAIFVEIKTNQGTRRWVLANSEQNAKLVDAVSDRIVGPLPRPGMWHQLEIPLHELPAGAIVEELKLGLFGGICFWDGITVSGLERPEDQLLHDPMAWWNYRKGQGAPYATPEVAQAIKEGPESAVGKEQRSEVEAYFYALIAADIPEELQRLRDAWTALRLSIQQVEARTPGTMIYKERDEPRQAYIMTRGQYDAKGEPVTSRTPEFLPSNQRQAEATRLTRLDLAKWLVANENPLVARVIVNRFWQQLFGIGLVKTSDDFGTQGTPPSHPELLDDLALRFRDSGWNVKQLLREMVLSEAFRRDSRFDNHHATLDPENRYLARGPRIRLDAEQIRDNALAVSGLLNRRVGGAGFRGYQPPKIWEPVGYGDSNTRFYIQQHGDDLYRRSLYAYVKRTAPPPFMSNFDAPNRETFCTRRERSNTPLQSLQLMNDVQHFEAARCFAERLLREVPYRENGSDDARIDRAFQRALCRSPDAYEKERVLEALQHFRERLSGSPDDAVQIARSGEAWPDPNLSATEVAPWTLVCNLILNLDETITRN